MYIVICGICQTKYIGQKKKNNVSRYMLKKYYMTDKWKKAKR